MLFDKSRMIGSALLLCLAMPLFSGHVFAEDLQDERKRPNIVLLLADDLGYGELGSYGQEKIRTPALDLLASQGARFTNFYAGAPVCAPSRAVLMTGLPTTQVGVRGNSGVFEGEHPWLRVPLRPDEATIAEVLQGVGYQTAFVGKWHLSDPNDINTWAFMRGFDHAAQTQWTMRNGGEKFVGAKVYINGKRDYLEYDISDWNSMDDFRSAIAFDFLDKMKRDDPFFLFLSYRAPHGNEREIGNKDLYSDRDWPEAQRVHAAKITLLDRYVGQLIMKLEALGELDNTIILFTSDNGPHAEGNDPEFFDSNASLTGIKRDLYEGGIRVPLIAYWNGNIPVQVVDTVTSFEDIFPTLADIAGADHISGYPGVSLRELLTIGVDEESSRTVQWEFQLDGHWQDLPFGGFRQAVRFDNWKAVRYGLGKSTELYNLSSDPGEQIDLAGEYPEIVELAESYFEDRVESQHYPYGGVLD